MVEANNYDEALRVLTEAEHNPAGERLIQLAQVHATLALAQELRSLRVSLAQLAGPGPDPAEG